MTDYETRWLAICNEAIRLEAKSVKLAADYEAMNKPKIQKMIEMGFLMKGYIPQGFIK